jgi:hypothetical protein
MKILDTKKAKEQHEAEKELHEFEEWLKSGVSSTAPPNYDDLKGLWDGCTSRPPWSPIAGKATMDPEKVQEMVNDLRKQFGLNP